MRHNAQLLLAILGFGLVAGQYYYPIRTDNGMPWRGEYGEREICPYGSNGTFAYALDFKFDDLNDLDNVGGNAVKLYCRNSAGSTNGYVTSLEGKRGKWQGIHSCPMHESFVGFRLRVFPDQGTWGDDFAVDNIQMACSDGTVLDGIDGVQRERVKFPNEEEEEEEEEEERNVIRVWMETLGRKIEAIRLRSGETRLHGDWGSWAYCSPDMYVVGIETVVEQGHIEDDAGLTDVTLYCS